jgi:hypothetical protein
MNLKFKVVDKELFLNISSYGTTKPSNTFFENKLKVSATSRKWYTINKLLAIAEE